MVGGFERVYEIGHDFRNEGMDRSHNPEFTMLELYQAYADYGDMMALVEALLADLVGLVTGGGTTLEREGVTLDFAPPFARVPFVDGIRRHSGVDVLTASEAEMRSRLIAAGVPADEANSFTGGKLLDEMFGTFLEPHCVQPTFVVDYPYSMAGPQRLGELGETEMRFEFEGDRVRMTATPLSFGGEAIVLTGKR